MSNLNITLEAYDQHFDSYDIPLVGNPRATKPWEVRWMLRKLQGMSGDICEIGSFSGETTLEFASAYPDKKVFSFDLPDALQDPMYFKHRGPSACWRAKHLSNVHSLLSEDWCMPMSDSNVSFVFIDGDHSWNGVERDTLKCFKWFRPSGTYHNLVGARHGTVAWHDYYWHPNRDSQVYQYLFFSASEFLPIRHVAATSLAYCDF